MQAIVTKFIPATNTKGSRIRAKCERGSIIISYDNALSNEDAHIAAANALCRKFIAEDVKKYGSPEHSNPWGLPRVSGQITTVVHVHVILPYQMTQAVSITTEALTDLRQGKCSTALDKITRAFARLQSV